MEDKKFTMSLILQQEPNRRDDDTFDLKFSVAEFEDAYLISRKFSEELR
ncbi:hypothetical protein [Nostoc sp. PCC 7107]|nr:hypothetical protein [Nostoc sp. PCC 7107]AFY40988.1 hypothetical protein Nos7107_0303 [Nostoc sp. PCC 7107]